MPTPSFSKSADALDWYDAIRAVVAGKKITRVEWGSSDCVFLHAERLHLRKADGTLHQLIVSEGDLLATDWIVVRET